MKKKKPKMYLQSTHKEDVRFEILSYNDKTGVAKLKGQYAVFEEALTVERMDKIGYKIVKEEDNADAMESSE